MRVLFVDDEEEVLAGIRRMLHRRDEWDATYALGGDAALQQLRCEPFDVVVTDMRMPEVDGAAVLRALQGEAPGTVRIALSGHTEMATAMRMVPFAHQFLAKPCAIDDLRATIERATRLQESLRRTELLPVVGGVQMLPSPPGVIIALNVALGREDVDIGEVAALVAQDPAISAKLLQLVNSAFFGLGQRIGEVGTAVRYLGLTTVRNLAIAVHAFQAVEASSAVADLVGAVQTHSSEIGDLSRRLTTDTRRGSEAFVGGLLHDIGTLVLASRAPDQLRAAVALSRSSNRPLVEIETEAFGASHADIGGYFLSLWGLPFSLVELVVAHHRPRALDGPLGPGDAIYLAQMVADHTSEIWPEAGSPLSSDELPDGAAVRDALAWQRGETGDRAAVPT